MLPDLTTLLIVCPLVFLGGLVDSIAGGGGLITLPGYLLAGVPPHMAIGTNKLSSAMGMAISTVRLYRGGFIDLKMSVVPVLSAFVGSLVGARIALMVPPSVFQIILVLCLPVAAFLVMRDKTLSPDGEEMEQKKRWLMLGLVSFACGAYDGFYGPGAGTFMLLGFAAAAQARRSRRGGPDEDRQLLERHRRPRALRGHGPRRLGARRPCRMLRHHGPTTSARAS